MSVYSVPGSKQGSHLIAVVIVGVVVLVLGAVEGDESLSQASKGLLTVQARDGRVVGVQVVEEAAITDTDDMEDNALNGL